MEQGSRAVCPTTTVTLTTGTSNVGPIAIAGAHTHYTHSDCSKCLIYMTVKVVSHPFDYMKVYNSNFGVIARKNKLAFEFLVVPTSYFMCRRHIVPRFNGLLVCLQNNACGQKMCIKN